MIITQLNEVGEFISSLPDRDSAKILAELKALEAGWTEALTIKTLKGRIKELIVSRYRIIFFRIGNTIYVVGVFRKKSKKTPTQIIKRAEQIYKIIDKTKNKK